ncbi:MAG: HAMP domain-containing protein, partial [Actinobacteria bacterium]|nr:HAMP domain-containing protein [Actinomycetota bacterium]
MKLRIGISGSMALVAVLVSVAGSLSAYNSTDTELSQNIDSNLLDAAVRVLEIPLEGNENEDEDGNEDSPIRPDRQSDLCPLALLQPIDAAQLIYSDGTVELCFTDSPLLPFDDQDIAKANESDLDLDDLRLDTVSVNGTQLRVITVPWTSTGALQYARDLSEIDEVLMGLKVRLFLAGLFATLGAWILGWFIAGRLARPIRRLSVVATEVATTRDLSINVPTKGAGEVGELGRSFSSMMTALSTSLEQQHRLVSDASHELRTPLTALRTNVESLELFQEIPEEERRAMIRDIRLEVEELATLTAELVDLATDQLRSAEPMGTVDLLTLTREIAER